MFSTNLLLENETRSITIEEVNNVPRTYFVSALENCTDCNNKYRECLNELYSTISTSQSDSKVINEAFEQFYNKMTGILKDIQKYTDTQFSDFSMALIRVVEKDKFILKEKDFLTSYKGEDFFIDRYKFINLESGIPKKIIRKEFQKEYEKIKEIISNKNTSNSEKLTALMYQYNSLINDMRDGYYDKFRGKLIGSNEKISRIEFAQVLFNVFRNGGKKLTTNVTSKEIKETYNRFSNMRNILTDLKKEKHEIDKQYQEIIKDLNTVKFEKIAPTFGENVEELEVNFDMYIKAKLDQILNMSNDNTMAYMAKLDAISSCYMQDREVLTSAMNRRREGVE